MADDKKAMESTREIVEHMAMMGRQDDCLLRLVEGKKPRPEYLDELPPWRAVMIAKLAFKLRLMSKEETQTLVDRAFDSKGGR